MNFLVWQKGLRGPAPSLNLIDPRTLLSWPQIEPSIISIVPLADREREMCLDRLIALHPCPEVEAA
ncbi:MULTISPECIES: hypothetical protein [unclassified Bradyrhizobium]|uniref:hypothetical protein n=1 Tax=unclassified Bradyrhizobium TaxID=2631580 RepID=UPI002915C80D|nr:MULTISPECIES: hypothetical protein [unclassified Bradyrhizobium]